MALIMAFSVMAEAMADNETNYLILGDSIGWGAGVLNSLGLTDATEPVINHEGINQSEFFSLKYFMYRLRTFFEKIFSIFTK